MIQYIIWCWQYNTDRISVKSSGHLLHRRLRVTRLTILIHYTGIDMCHGLPYSSIKLLLVCSLTLIGLWLSWTPGSSADPDWPEQDKCQHGELVRLCDNAGPSTNTLAQNWANVLPRCRVWCDRSETWQTYSVGLMVGQRLRRWTSIEPTAGKSFFLRRRDCRHSTQWHWQWHQVRESLTNKQYIYTHAATSITGNLFISQANKLEN